MAILLMSYMNFLIFFVENVMIYSIIIGMIVIMSSMIFIIGSCKMAATFRDWIWLYFLLDSIMVSVCTCLIGYAGMLTIMLPPEIYAYIVAAAMNMNFFFFAGSSRVIVVYGIMKRWETLMYKMAIKVSLLGYLILAAYFMSNDIGAALGLDDEKGNVLEQFFFLYIFGLFTLYMDIFSKISDIDGSSSLQYHFRLDD